MVAFDTGEDTVRPCRRTTLSSGKNVVNRQFFTAWTTIAVLTHERITLKDIATAECHNVVRRLVVVRQRDDFRDLQTQPLSLNKSFAIYRLKKRPFAPVVLQETVGVHDPSGFIPDFD